MEKKTKVETFGTIDGEKIVYSKKKYKNTQINVYTLIAKGTFKNISKGTNKAVGIDYDDFQKLVKEHFDEKIKKPGKRYQINIWSNQGWRSGKSFDGVENIDFYNPAIYYNEGVDNIEEVFGIQILEI